jgi:hypothetical protein
MIRSSLLVVVSFALTASAARAQLPATRGGEAIPRDMREIYDRGLQYLASKQTDKGDWQDGGQQGPGVTGMALMVLLASGEDPNFGLYSNHVRRALRNIISQQDAGTGIMGSSMYHHGFSMLALAEAYGTVDDRNLWTGGEANRRSIGQALELAVRAAITSQKKNSLGAWRYSPDATDADTSVSGAVLVGLLAARNAGVEVPDEVTDKAITYYTKMTSPSGEVGYSGLGGFGESTARSSIASLVYAVARRKDLPQFKHTLANLTKRLEGSDQNYPEYARYYQAQALFQGDVEAWEKWNKLLVRQLKAAQLPDGSFKSQFGATVGTSLSLLALALNYRFLPIYER